MSYGPSVITCECKGQFQLPPGGLSRAICPHCRQEVFISPQGFARYVVPPHLLQGASPSWKPNGPPASKNPVPLILGIIGAMVVAMGLMVVLCAGVFFFRARNAINNVNNNFARNSPFAPEVSKVQVDAPPPRPLVRFADYETSGARLPISPGREFRKTADRLKSAEQFAEAETSYLAALQADPKYANAAYQLACNYVLWGKLDQGKTWFDKALELGFSDYDCCVNDNELGEIRNQPDFAEKLALIQQRYQNREQFLGSPVLFDTENGQSKALIILLHGYGDTHEAYFDNAQAFNRQGFRAVAMPGSVPYLDDGFHWSDVSTEVTHQAIQKILADPLVAHKQEKVFLLGFSQGGAHAMDLCAKYPEIYAGGVILSPGGSLLPFGRGGHLTLRGTGCFYVVHGSEEIHGMFTEPWRQDCKAAGWRYDVLVHPGGHHFPLDWEDRLPAITKFLLNE